MKTTQWIAARMIAVLALSCVLAGPVFAPALAPVLADDIASVAILDFELIDTSLEGEVGGTRPDEQNRLILIGNDLRERVRDSGRYRVVDHSPARTLIDETGYIHTCNKCQAKIGKALGVDLVFSGTVQKVSNLILNINVYVHDAETGDPVRGYSVDIRGNTDKSWLRGISYLARNRLLK